jgi:adenine-specific DNA-methyltransferase
MNTNGKPYGPASPHPLSQLRTELIWEGKYDVYGNRREVDVAGCAMPMQMIETIDQPRSEADHREWCPEQSREEQRAHSLEV